MKKKSDCAAQRDRYEKWNLMKSGEIIASDNKILNFLNNKTHHNVTYQNSFFTEFHNWSA